MEEADKEIIIAIVIATTVILILSVFTVLFFMIFVRKKKILNKKRDELAENYEKQLLQTKLEIQEQTLNNISREIHDNIGQVLSFVKLSLGTAAKLNTEDKQLKIEESVNLVSEVINDLRDLSKSLSFEKIKKEGLNKAIADEVGRINRSGIIETTLTVNGTPYGFNAQNDLIIYRIFQEIINNSLKHAESNTLIINLNYSFNLFTLTVSDNGKGFDASNLNSEGSGLLNMRQRAELINAVIEVNSRPGKGCKTILVMEINPEKLELN
ncbi:sensor histidine kinase [Pedobacter metabolipauper]|uniref:histidine kinase n=1 Tax=Pedobacter metabolipauper TaxID=425513 RepID=A0A4V3D1I7_9SPHI|nr:sensor histidine kinase [Pedobacter metabolipauper]TDQ11373.1 hypothetical protein ATK78_0491 [Pedobacter metabolipauper]